MNRYLVLFAPALALLAAGSGCRAPSRVAAPSSHGKESAALCEMCGKPIVLDKAVRLKTASGQRKVLRCVHCGIMALAHNYDGATVFANTPAGSRVAISRHGSKWQAVPATALFVALPETKGECLDQHKAFASQKEFQAYLASHPDFAAQKPVPRTIADWQKLVAEGMPAEHSDSSDSDSSEASDNHPHC